MIEYTGEVVRATIADRREHLTYNSLVGAGTYMFQIDGNRVIDATKAGNIAHLINHSCEPNCFSRIITVNGDEHVIIFAKRDIEQWEELTYNYRFLSVDEQLACYCGVPRCRGVVNDIKAVEQVAKLCVPRSDLKQRRRTSVNRRPDNLDPFLITFLFNTEVFIHCSRKDSLFTFDLNFPPPIRRNHIFFK